MPVWRNGRRKGLKIRKSGLSDSFTYLHKLRAKTSILLVKTAFIHARLRARAKIASVAKSVAIR